MSNIYSRMIKINHQELIHHVEVQDQSRRAQSQTLVKESQSQSRVKSKLKPGQRKSKLDRRESKSKPGQSKVKGSQPFCKFDQDKKNSRSEAHGWTHTFDRSDRMTPRHTLMAYLITTVKSARVANGRPPGSEDLPLIVQVLTSKKDKGTRVVSHVRTSTPRVMKLLSRLEISKWRGVSHGRPSERWDHPSASGWGWFQTHFK